MSLFPELEPRELHPEPRRQFNNPDRQFWGRSFEQFSAIDRKEYDDAVREVTMSLADNDKSIGRITSDFSKQFKARGGKRGLGKKGVLELMFRIGVLLNEIDEARR